MDVRVKLFAGLRERAGADELPLTLPDGARVADALARLSDVTAGVSVVLAVHQEFADASARRPRGGAHPRGSREGRRPSRPQRMCGSPTSRSRSMRSPSGSVTRG